MNMKYNTFNSYFVSFDFINILHLFSLLSGKGELYTYKTYVSILIYLYRHDLCAKQTF